jgi:hypothetical protein
MGNIKSVITRCMKIGVAIAIALVGLATPTHADPTPDPSDPIGDSNFRYLLDHHGVLFDFNLEKYQGKRACQDFRAGKTYNELIHDLMSYGGYSFDIANAIVASATVAYCSDVPMH